MVMISVLNENDIRKANRKRKITVLNIYSIFFGMKWLWCFFFIFCFF